MKNTIIHYRNSPLEIRGKIPVNALVGVFYGLSDEGHLRLSILSLCSGPKMESTRQLEGNAGRGVPWDLLDML